MGSAVPLRTDYDGETVPRLTRASDDANQTRRLLALAIIYDGGKRSDAAALGGVRLQVIRDWVLRFNTSGYAGLIDRKAPGQSSSSMTINARRWPGSSRTGRSRRSMAWCAGV